MTTSYSAHQNAIFAGQRVHILMLNDAIRTNAYLAALREVVRPGDVVLDIGTGTGVLAVAAALAGAAHVYAVEVQAWAADCARGLAAANGVADRMTVIEGWSSAIELPRRADVLVTETLGCTPLEENILEIVMDAKARLLQPNARIIPRHLSVDALPVRVPEAVVRQWRFAPSTARRWTRDYGIDFSSLGARHDPMVFHLVSKRVEAWKRGHLPVRVADIDLMTLADAHIDSVGRVPHVAAEPFNALSVTWEAELADGITLASAVPVDRTYPCWATALYVLPEPIKPQPGSALDVTFRYVPVDNSEDHRHPVVTATVVDVSPQGSAAGPSSGVAGTI